MTKIRGIQDLQINDKHVVQHQVIECALDVCCVLEHLLITFAYSSQPARRGEVYCIVQLLSDM